MKHRILSPLGIACLALIGPGAAFAQSTAVVDFDPPGTPQGPSIFVAVPAAQTIVTTPATFSGGVVLGLATFFPAIKFATGPNVYGTADFGNNLPRLLTINIDPGFGDVNEVSFALFNGETYTESYTVRAFNGSTLVNTQSINNILPNFNSGYAIADITSASSPITSVTITTATNANASWDFLIDTVTFNQSITSVVPAPVYSPPPAPAVPPPPPVIVTPAPPPLPSVENQKPEVVQLTQEQYNGRKTQKRKRNGRDEDVTTVTVINFGDDSVNSKSNTLDLDITNLTVQIFTPLQSPVPEPSTWAMLAAGLIGIGGLRMGRRRHDTAQRR